MVSDKVDMSLDDIISSSRRGRGRGRGAGQARGGARGGSRGGRGGGGGGPQRSRGGSRSATPYSRPARIPDKWEHDMHESYDSPKQRQGGAGGQSPGGGLSTGTHLQISNLDFGVTEADVKELFSEFGALKKSTVNYDSSGRSQGTADVIFQKREHAVKAHRTYNGVPLDGRPMKIEIAVEKLPAARAPASARLSFGGVQQRNGGGGGGGFRSGGGGRGGGSRGGNRGGGGGRGNRGDRGGNRGGGRGGRGRIERTPVPSKDDLDSELESYTKQSD